MPKPSTPFPSTHWVDIHDWKAATTAQRQQLLQRFYLRYRRPLIGFVVASGYTEDAEDIVHEFVMQQIEGRLFDSADPSKGRFRDLLLRALKNFLTSRYRADHAQRRRPAGGFVGLDEYVNLFVSTDSPEHAFEQAWVRSVIDNTLQRLQDDFTDKAQHEHLAIFRARLVDPILHGIARPSVAELANDHHVSEAQASNFILTAKRAFVRHLRAEVMEYASSRKDAAVEIQDIVQFLTHQDTAS
jgi:RNA polymerase sigma factor (sigma-70 family)